MKPPSILESAISGSGLEKPIVLRENQVRVNNGWMSPSLTIIVDKVSHLFTQKNMLTDNASRSFPINASVPHFVSYLHHQSSMGLELTPAFSQFG